MKLSIIAMLGILTLGIGCTPKHALLSAKGYDVVRPQFADVPVAEGFKYLKEKSYRFEYDWKGVRHGRLFYRGDLPADEVQDYYREKMLSANWQESGYSGGEKASIAFEKGTGTSRERCVVTIYTLKKKTMVEIQLDPMK